MSVPPFPPPADPRPLPELAAPAPGITLAWFPEEQDYVEAFRAVSGRQRRRQAVTNTAIALGTAAVGLLVDQALLVVVGIVLAVSGLYIAGPGHRELVKRAWQGSTQLQGFHQVFVSAENGVTEWGPGCVGTSAWSRYGAVVETERVFALKVRDLAGTHIEIIAKRGLPPEVDPAWFGDALRRWIGGTPAGR